MSVGDPVHGVEHHEHGRRDPHGPGVDVVHERLLPRRQAELNVLKIWKNLVFSSG